MQVEVVKGKLFYHVNLVGDNGEVVLTSETYYSKSNAHRSYLRVLSELNDTQVLNEPKRKKGKK